MRKSLLYMFFFLAGFFSIWSGGALAVETEATPGPPPQPLTQKQLERFIDRMQEVYDATKSLEAEFEQKYKSAIGKLSESKGRVAFKKPGKMRWSYSEPSPKEFIADGKRLWIVDEEERTVFSSEFHAVMMPVSVTFLWGEGNLRESFEIYGDPENRSDSTSLKLILSPKGEKSFVKKLIFKVDAKSYRITDAMLIDPAGNKNYLKFTNIRENPVLPDALFLYKIPKDYHIINAPKEN